MDKSGVIFSLPLTCGACDVVFDVVLLRWCSCCGNAICPTCYPDEDHKGLDKCMRCIIEGKHDGMYWLGYKQAYEREKKILDAFLKD